MKVFTDQSKISFFKTDNHVKNLHPIEINTIYDFVYKYSLDEMILLGIKAWMVTRFDELKAGNPVIDTSEEPELHGEWMDIDFVSGMKNLDILIEIVKYVAVDSSFFEELEVAGVFSEIHQEWINSGDDELWTIKEYNDKRTLQIIIDSNHEVTTQIQEGE